MVGPPTDLAEAGAPEISRGGKSEKSGGAPRDVIDIDVSQQGQCCPVDILSGRRPDAPKIANGFVARAKANIGGSANRLNEKMSHADACELGVRGSYFGWFERFGAE